MNRFLLSVLLIGLSEASRIELTTSPSEVTPGLTRQSTVRCSLKDTAPAVVGKRATFEQTDDNVPEVSSIILMLDGRDVASVSHSFPAQVMDGSANLKVSGSVNQNNGEQGYLELSFDYPKANNTGEFVCEVNAVRSFHNIVFSTSKEVSFRNLTMDDMANFIESADKIIESLKQYSKTAIAFSATQTKLTSTRRNDNVLFDKVLTNLGSAYNAGTGEFLCPLDGYYQFAYSGLVNSIDTHLYFQLRKNDTPVSAIWSDYPQSKTDESSNSVILKLAKGDVVKVVAKGDSTTYNDANEIFTSFSGHLIWPGQ